MIDINIQFAKADLQVTANKISYQYLHEALKYIAGEVRNSIQRNLETSTDYAGNKVAPISRAWAERKGKFLGVGVFWKNFLWKGILYRSVAMEEEQSGYKIFIKDLYTGKDARSEVAYFLNQDRPFFGISTERANVIVKHFQQTGESLRQAV